MSSMSKIAYLCENELKDELIEELNMSDLISLTGKSPEEIADGFIDAHKNMKEKRNQKAYKKLNEIHDELLFTNLNKD